MVSIKEFGRTAHQQSIDYKPGYHWLQPYVKSIK